MQGKTELARVFEFVSARPNVSARTIGSKVGVGRRRANQLLYSYLDILFEKRGLTPPLWSVKSDDAYEKMLVRVREVPEKPLVRDLPAFNICNSCGLPIKPNNECGCS